MYNTLPWSEQISSGFMPCRSWVNKVHGMKEILGTCTFSHVLIRYPHLVNRQLWTTLFNHSKSNSKLIGCHASFTWETMVIPAFLKLSVQSSFSNSCLLDGNSNGIGESTEHLESRSADAGLTRPKLCYPIPLACSCRSIPQYFSKL